MRKFIYYLFNAVIDRNNTGSIYTVLALIVAITITITDFHFTTGVIILNCTMIIIGQMWFIAAWVKEGHK